MCSRNLLLVTHARLAYKHPELNRIMRLNRVMSMKPQAELKARIMTETRVVALADTSKRTGINSLVLLVGLLVLIISIRIVSGF